ncbi:MAG: DNA-formamidopyrimidine glycosylase family protein [Nannocystales bacterium]
MPELPEVEFGRRQLAEALVGETIAEVDAADDCIVYEGVSPEMVVAALRGARVLGAHRRGKQLWLSLDRRPWPLFHFGMTGGFVTPDAPGLQLHTGPSLGAVWPPRFSKLVLTTASGRRLSMTNARRLGRIRLREDPPNESPIAELGFDPLLEPPEAETLLEKLKRRRGALKGLLLDQRFAAGVGNWVADEVLHAAGLDPRRVANTLSIQDAQRLAWALTDITKKAVDADADADRYPKGWLFHRRWHPTEGMTTAKGDAIELLTVAGRTTVWVPARQH